MNTPAGKAFVCRVCGHDSYKEETTGNIVEDVIHVDVRDTAECEKVDITIGYSCCACTVTFQDPDKFSK